MPSVPMQTVTTALKKITFALKRKYPRVEYALVKLST
jgi:hypothetical protein